MTEVYLSRSWLARKLEIELHGELAGILGLTSEKAGTQRMPAESIKLVAGARKQRESLILPVQL